MTQTQVTNDKGAPVRYATPRCDVWETGEGATLLMDLPGVAPAGLDLQVEDDLLVVTAHADDAPRVGRSIYSEWTPTHFRRTFLLTADADRENVRATLRDGVLEVVVPKAEAARSRRIEVK